MKDKFYVTKCPPGRAEGADSWDTYMSHGSERSFEPTYEPEIDQSLDENGNPQPLDWFFNDN